MLNISHNQLNKKVELTSFKSGKVIFNKHYYKQLNKFLLAFTLIILIILFLPWTQNITGQGLVTTLKPGQRPQTIQSQIPGRVEQWFVQEGDYVKKGDTIIRISEIKSEYFDDQLVERTNDQRMAKASSVVAYESKVDALNRQIAAVKTEQQLKLQQAKNKLLQSHLKVKSDSIDFEAAKTNLEIARSQFNRIEQLQAEGLKAVKDVEEKRLKLQETQAKLISQENKLLASINDIINAEVEISRITASYADKISKTQSDMFTAQSNQFDAEAQVSKLENNYENYKIRNSLLYVTAPQSGYINKVLVGGIGEAFKEGDKLISIMPEHYDLAIDTYVKPIDLPLLHLKEKVRVQFDGWPAIVFSGWPNVSYGTYGAKIVAIENFISDNGMYRILLAPDPEDYPWPKAIRVGSGAKTMALLEDVPIWFELWRQINSFPPNYYQPNKTALKKDKK
ncbi:MAG: biotin/lipoyl-binding protein [Flavobacteriales bacterium]|nr:biotin/lipoyl-binding protein [Flavobacteriia bacterium]NCP06333.1 biotin/lipoyl-binding protein [Flavobacteriales bacterium]PIV94333.1 MAG: biotin attachment protein [Flavobacteriaceae bacterium CG17_big_fil_post_rev_8_21_14_2_50_33_15]PIY13251.1 MAG: biotin attachment protein [Flavobacteriaceae bacterium CG_4_10_14_3_um_filter_33_47]PJB18636.1 MAG: biotin attachment protein [Flavobacteriaceae bacterium CG_4_9_14_3_um_filter_33_16]